MGDMQESAAVAKITSTMALWIVVQNPKRLLHIFSVLLVYNI